MIVQEKISDTLIKTYSDQNFYIIQSGTGIKYISAVDPVSMGRTYTESNELIPQITNNIPDSEALNIITGGQA